MLSTTSRVLICFLALSFLLSLTAPRVNAQVLYGSVVGTVTDQTGAVVPKAIVTISSAETGLTREATSDAGGRYSIMSVLAGNYSLKVNAAGFKPLSETGVQVVINTVARHDVRLEVGAVAESISVEGTALLLTTDKADMHTELGATAIANLPLLAYRNYQALMVTVPGATPVSYQNDITDSPSRSLRTNVNGGNPNNNNTRVDGAANIFIWLPHHTLLNPPVESIETVNISTNAFDAEQGMTGAAAITVTTKSGTNDIHGTAFWYHDNQHFYARPYFWYQPKPLSIRNIPGGTIGGPIKKNKLFYFFSFERTMEHVGLTGNYSVPPEDVRRGDFSKYAAYSTIYDPLTGNPDGSGRTPFPNNIVPKERISSIFDNIQKLCPLPNQKAFDTWGLDRQYGVSGMRKMDRNQYDLKVNWSTSTKLLIFGKYSRMDADVGGKYAFGELTGPGLGGSNGNGLTHVHMPSFGYNYTLTPTFLMDGVFGYSRMDQQVLGPHYGKNWGLDVWKIPGTNGAGKYASDPRYGDQPRISQGFDDWGFTPDWFPVFRHDRSYTYSTNFSKVKRAHEIRWGFDMVRHELNHWQPETANPRGAIGFAGAATMIKGGVTRGINTYAAALMGIVSSYDKSVQFFDMKTREWQLGWYVRDRWQATRNLTVNLGLRYEYYPLINRGDRGIERWDPATNIATFGGLGNIPMSNGITVSKKLFSPRLGLAYRLGNKTVIRTGYGLAPDPLPFSRPLRGLYPATVTASWRPVEQYGSFNTIDQGIPEVPLPDVSKGSLVLPKNVDMGPRSPWGGLLHRGYTQSWNFTIERQLPAQLVGSIAYVGNHMVHQLLDRDINAALVLGSGNAGRPLYATQGRTGGMSMWDGWADANYNGLQATLNRQYRGLYLKTSYTWSKSIDYADEDGWQGVDFNHPLQLRRNRAPAGYDRRHMLVTAWVYDLPFGRGQKFNIGNRVLDTVAGGWKVNGLLSMYTGTPFSVSASTASSNMPGTPQRADILRSPTKLSQVGPGTQYYDIGAFSDPNWDRPSNVYRLGTSGRNTVYGPGFIRPDLSLFKTFKVTERVRVEFKAEAFNFTNTPRFSNPGGNVSAMSRDSKTGNITNTNNFMAITGASGERQGRLGLKLTF